MASTAVEEAGFGGGMTTFTTGIGEEELAEVLTPELIPLRLRKFRMLAHEEIPIPRNSPCEEDFLAHRDSHVEYAIIDMVNRDRVRYHYQRLVGGVCLSRVTVSVCDRS